MDNPGWFKWIQRIFLYTVAICRWIVPKNGKTHSNKNLYFTLKKTAFLHKVLFREIEQFQHGLHISQPTRPFRRSFISKFFTAHVGVLENDHLIIKLKRSGHAYVINKNMFAHTLAWTRRFLAGFHNNDYDCVFHYVVNTSPNTAADRAQLTQHFFSGYSRGEFKAAIFWKVKLVVLQFFWLQFP